MTWCDSQNADGCRLVQEAARWDGGRLILIKERQTHGHVFAMQEVFRSLLEPPSNELFTRAKAASLAARGSPRGKGEPRFRAHPCTEPVVASTAHSYFADARADGAEQNARNLVDPRGRMQPPENDRRNRGWYRSLVAWRRAVIPLLKSLTRMTPMGILRRSARLGGTQPPEAKSSVRCSSTEASGKRVFRKNVAKWEDNCNIYTVFFFFFWGGGGGGGGDSRPCERSELRKCPLATESMIGKRWRLSRRHVRVRVFFEDETQTTGWMTANRNWTPPRRDTSPVTAKWRSGKLLAGMTQDYRHLAIKADLSAAS